MSEVVRRSAKPVAPDDELLVGVEAVAAVLGVHHRHIPALIRRGLPLAPLGWRKATTRRLVREWVEAMAQKEGKNV
jgi:hypothetical protein